MTLTTRALVKPLGLRRDPGARPGLAVGRIGHMGAGVGLAWLALMAPAFAGMAEREPPPAVLWLLVIGVAALSWVMACRRWWLPLALWVPVALFDSALVADLVDPVIGPAVREELGLSYLMQADLASALTLVLPLMFANVMFSRRDDEKPRRPRDIWRR